MLRIPTLHLVSQHRGVQSCNSQASVSLGRSNNLDVEATFVGALLLKLCKVSLGEAPTPVYRGKMATKLLRPCFHLPLTRLQGAAHGRFHASRFNLSRRRSYVTTCAADEQCVRRMRKLSPAKGRRKLSLAGESNWPVGEWANGLNPTQTLMLVLSAKGQQLALPYLCSMTCEARDPPVDLTGPDLEAASCGSSKRSHRPADDIWDHFKKVKFLLRSYILGFTIYYKP